MIVDGRDPEEFAHGHIDGSVNVGLSGRYAEFAGSVVPSDVDIVLVVDPGFELEAKNRLGRIGFDRPRQVVPCLAGTAKKGRRGHEYCGCTEPIRRRCCRQRLPPQPLMCETRCQLV